MDYVDQTKKLNNSMFTHSKSRFDHVSLTILIFTFKIYDMFDGS